MARERVEGGKDSTQRTIAGERLERERKRGRRVTKKIIPRNHTFYRRR
jgi:hypothetical protein